MCENMEGQNLRITLDVTQEQSDTIQHLFLHNKWDYSERNRSLIDVNGMISGTDAATQTSDIVSQNEVSDNDWEPFQIDQNIDEEECVYCLCRPCITSEQNRQLWWESENAEPSDRSHGLRKEIYKRFWTMMFHRKCWEDPRYISNKTIAMRNDPRLKRFTWHRRDIMPKCVLSLVRQWYPNLPGVPYLGHMWE